MTWWHGSGLCITGPLWVELTAYSETDGNRRISLIHYRDVIMGAIECQITSVSIVYSTVCSGPDQRQHQSFRVTGLCEGNSPVTGEFPAQSASNAENISMWWRHHDKRLYGALMLLSGQAHKYLKGVKPIPFLITKYSVHSCVVVVVMMGKIITWVYIYIYIYTSFTNMVRLVERWVWINSNYIHPLLYPLTSTAV